MAIGDNNNPGPDFWLNLAAEHIYNSADRRTESVKSLKTIIVWAFGIFATGGFVTLFGQLKDFHDWSLILFGIAFFLFTLAYYIATRAEFPKVEKFKLGQPATIADAYSNTVKSQAAIFKIASGLTGLAFFFLASGILVEFNTIKKRNPPQPGVTAKDLFIKTGIEKKGDTTYVPATIEWRKSEPISLSYIQVIPKKGTTSAQERTLFSEVYYTDTSGRFFHTYRLLKEDSVQNLIVKVSVAQKITKDTTVEKMMSVKLSVPQ